MKLPPWRRLAQETRHALPNEKKEDACLIRSLVLVTAAADELGELWSVEYKLMEEYHFQIVE